MLVFGTMTEVAALVESAFAAMDARGWILMIPPPLPLDWPDGPLVYYAYARRHRHGLVDGHEVSSPWARVERRRRLFGGHRLDLVQLTAQRSEEHTSELQSLAYLVCRLLLEK